MTAAGQRQDEPNDDLPDIKAALAGDIGRVAEALVGDVPNKAASTKRTLRFGSKGALVVEIEGRKRGAWFDHAARKGGGPLDLVLYLRGQGFADALDWARRWTGIGREDGPRHSPPPPRSPPPANDDDAKAGIAAAQRLWGESQLVAGTLAERYLVRVRGIPAPTGGWPDAVRYHARSRSLILAATVSDGTVQAVQRVFLAPDGSNARDEAGQKVKRSRGPQTRAAVRLAAMPGRASGPLLLAEGPETGLSLWRATGYEVWVLLGSIGKAEPPPGRRVVACADDDPPAHDFRHGGAAKRLRQALRGWRQAGLDVVKATPYAQQLWTKRDFNDVLQESGLDAVRARVEWALCPPVAASVRVGVEEARAALGKAVNRFFAAALAWQAPEEENTAAPPPPVHMIRVDVGVGKSAAARRQAVKMLTRMRAAGDERTLAIAVPTHRLGDEQAAAFEALAEAKALGLTARVWRGRAAPDPVRQDHAMCDDLEAVKLVQDAMGDVQRQACGGGKLDGPECPFNRTCGYQRQKRQVSPDVWIVAHELLFTQTPRELGELAAVVVDESFWQAGLRPTTSFPLDCLDSPADVPGSMSASVRLEFLRRRLLDVLRDLPDGPVPRAALLAALFSPSNTGEAYSLEWRRKVVPAMVPAMTREARQAACEAAAINRDVARMAGLWGAVKALVADDGPERSGWVELTRDKDGGRMLRLSGRKELGKAWQVPTLILDATLDPLLVRPYYPHAELVASLAVAAPHQRIRQVIDRTYSKAMLAPATPEEAAAHPETAAGKRRNLQRLRGIIGRQARLHRPGHVLVVVQKAVEEALRACGPLPPGIELAHHNAISGLDQWSDVRGLIVVGRTQPGPRVVKELAEQLTGRAMMGTDDSSYTRTSAARELAGGKAAAAEADRHVDPVAEAVRWQIAEGELLQIIGRGRGVNRNADRPLDVLVMTDIPLPLPVAEELTDADLDPSPLDAMLTEGGVALLNPRDAAAAYPGLWRTWEGAKKAMERDQKGTKPKEDSLFRVCPLLVRVSYQVAGERRRRVEAVVDLAVVPDPRAWLEVRLGSLAWFERVMDMPADAPANPARAAPGADPVHVDGMMEEQMRGTTDHPAVAAGLEPGNCGGLDPGLIYRGPMAWQPPELLLHAGSGRMIEVPSSPPPVASPWLLLPTRPAPPWYDALDPGGTEDGVVWWGPLRPVIAPELAGLAFRRRGGPLPAVTVV